MNLANLKITHHFARLVGRIIRKKGVYCTRSMATPWERGRFNTVQLPRNVRTATDGDHLRLLTKRYVATSWLGSRIYNDQ